MAHSPRSTTTCKRCISALVAFCLSASVFFLLDQYVLAPQVLVNIRYCDSSFTKSAPISCVPCPNNAICEQGVVSGCDDRYLLDESDKHRQCVRDSSLLSRVEKLRRCADLVRQRYAIIRLCAEHSRIYRALSTEKLRRDARATRLNVLEMKDQMMFFCPGTSSSGTFHEDFKHWILQAEDEEREGLRSKNSEGFTEFLLHNYTLAALPALQFLEERSQQGLDVSPTCKLELRLLVQLSWPRVMVALFVARVAQCLQRRAWRRSTAKSTVKKIVTALKSSRKRQLNEFDVKAMLKVTNTRERNRIWPMVERLALAERRIRIFPEYVFGEVLIMWEYI